MSTYILLDSFVFFYRSILAWIAFMFIWLYESIKLTNFSLKIVYLSYNVQWIIYSIRLNAVERFVYFFWNWQYLSLEFVLYQKEVAFVLFCDQIYSQSQMPISPWSSNPMQIRLRVFGKIKVNHYIHRLNIYPSRDQVWAHQNSTSSFAKVVKYPASLVLRHFGVNIEARIAQLWDFLCK